jgi:hypothetical protein
VIGLDNLTNDAWVRYVQNADDGHVVCLGMVLMQAVADLAYGIRRGLITQTLQITSGIRDSRDAIAEPEVALMFLQSISAAECCAHLTAYTQGELTLSPQRLLQRAVSLGSEPSPMARGRPRVTLTAEEYALKEERRRAFQQAYQKQYRRASRANGKEAA